jgi:hypothetical protein
MANRLNPISLKDFQPFGCCLVELLGFAATAASIRNRAVLLPDLGGAAASDGGRWNVQG